MLRLRLALVYRVRGNNEWGGGGVSRGCCTMVTAHLHQVIGQAPGASHSARIKWTKQPSVALRHAQLVSECLPRSPFNAHYQRWIGTWNVPGMFHESVMLSGGSETMRPIARLSVQLCVCLCVRAFDVHTYWSRGVQHTGMHSA